MFGVLIGVLTLVVVGHTLPAAQGPLPLWELLLALAGCYAAVLLVWGGLQAALAVRYKDK